MQTPGDHPGRARQPRDTAGLGEILRERLLPVPILSLQPPHGRQLDAIAQRPHARDHARIWSKLDPVTVRTRTLE